MRIFQWNPGEYRRFSVGNHISEAAHGGDEPDPEAVVDLGAQIIDIDVHDVGILAGLSEDAGERVLSGYGLPAVVEQKAKQIELPFCQLDFLLYNMRRAVFRRARYIALDFSASASSAHDAERRRQGQGGN